VTLNVGILLAVACALATQLGFLYKHKGANEAPRVDVRRPLATIRSLFASKWFALGMGVAVAAWGFHVAAMAFAPLSVVQAVLSTGVVMLAVLAERLFGFEVGVRQWIGVGMTAIGLLLLVLTVPADPGTHSAYSVAGMVTFEGGMLAIGALLISGPSLGAPDHHHGVMLGAAAGVLFGVSDVAIKALSGLIGAQGIFALLTPWTLVCVLASIGAFFASAKGLQDGDAVPVIAVTGTAANLAGIVGGILVFGDPLPGDPVSLIVQCLAFVLVLLAAWLMPAPVRTGAAPAAAAPAAA
jgi:drug/metabolite transporter (DMT)-like permease